jgi:hypothetical protein
LGKIAGRTTFRQPFCDRNFFPFHQFTPAFGATGVKVNAERVKRCGVGGGLGERAFQLGDFHRAVLGNVSAIAPRFLRHMRALSVYPAPPEKLPHDRFPEEL